MHTQGKDLVIVSSATHIKELIDAPESQLSLHAVAKDVSPVMEYLCYY